MRRGVVWVKDHGASVLLAVVVALTAIAVGWLVWQVTHVADDNQTLENRVEQRDRAIDALDSSQQALAEQVRALGGEPVTDVTVPPLEEPELVEPRGPTDAQVLMGITNYFAQHPEDLPLDAPAPTDAQVLLGITNYFASHPEDLPRDGIDGEDGAPGVNGQDGRDAPPPTQEQVNIGVANVLAADPGLLPPGPQGEPGKDAPPPTDEQVAAAVLVILAAHPELFPPPLAPTQAQVEAAVLAILTANPGMLPKGDTGPPPSSWTFQVNNRLYTCLPTVPAGTVFQCSESRA